MKKRVIILGGGVAGLSAAHELLERGFEVEVHELRGIPGGKARSMCVPHSGSEGRKDLPGEHGFRFVPGFYRHLPHTMSRIPYGNNRKGVLGNLVDTEQELLGASHRKPFITLPRFPRSLSDLKLLLKIPNELHEMGLTDDDLHFFASRFMQIMTSCWTRRNEEYERVSWWDFIDAPSRSKQYRDYLAVGMTRTLVACKAERASTKTIGDIGLQLVINMAAPGENSDRVLNGPTNDVWIDPWLKFLLSKGLEYHRHSRLESFNMSARKIQSVTVRHSHQTHEVTGDFYLAALPVEVMARYLTKEMLDVDPVLEGIIKLRSEVAWMNGLQFYLKEDVPIVRGHEMFLDTPWALTSISQAQFWPHTKWSDYADGKVRGCLSVDVSEWEKPGILYGKTAQECTPDELTAEVWAQLKCCLNNGGATVLKDDNIHSWFIDPDIYSPDHNPSTHANAEPLLVNTIGTWALRPFAYTSIPNLFLASDYVRTYTDLACMEGANEAARRAVNAIIDASGARATYCKIWPLHEPDFFAPWRNHDYVRFRQGLPWQTTFDGTFGSAVGNVWRGLLGLIWSTIHLPVRFNRRIRGY